MGGYGKQTGHSLNFKQCCIFSDSAIVGAGRYGEYDFSSLTREQKVESNELHLLALL